MNLFFDALPWLIGVPLVIGWCVAMWGDNSIPKDKRGNPDR